MSESIEASGSKLCANLVGASLSGSFIAYEVLWRKSDGPYHYDELLKYVLFAVGSYASAALLVHASRRSKFMRKVPSWILVAVLGSMILVGCFVVSHTVFMLSHPDPWDHEGGVSFPQKILAELQRAVPFVSMFTVIYSLLALPIMAAVYYSASLIQWARR